MVNSSNDTLSNMKISYVQGYDYMEKTYTFRLGFHFG
jgi:hypothetical protein